MPIFKKKNIREMFEKFYFYFVSTISQPYYYSLSNLSREKKLSYHDSIFQGQRTQVRLIFNICKIPYAFNQAIEQFNNEMIFIIMTSNWLEKALPLWSFFPILQRAITTVSSRDLGCNILFYYCVKFLESHVF